MTCSRKMLSELRLAVGCFVAFLLVLVLLNILQREHRLDTLRHASSAFPWAVWQSAQIQLCLFPSRGTRGWLPAKRAELKMH